MSDYIPNPSDPRDPLNPKVGTDRTLYETAPAASGNGIYVVLGSLVVAVLVAGFLMFSGPRDGRMDQATLPTTAPPIERTTPAMPAPTPAIPTPAAPQRQ